MQRRDTERTKVVAGIGAHIVGFALIEAFGTLQYTPQSFNNGRNVNNSSVLMLRSPFIYNPMMSLVAVLLAASMIGVVVSLGQIEAHEQRKSPSSAKALKGPWE
eukprot:849634-Amphidinium_carterae.1